MGGVPDEHTLLSVRLELLVLVLLNMDVGSAAKNAQMGYIWLRLMLELKWSAGA